MSINEIYISDCCRTCLKTDVPLRSIFEIAVDDISFNLLIVSQKSIGKFLSTKNFF